MCGIKPYLCAVLIFIVMKKRITQQDYLKAHRKASREAEIEDHGHPVGFKRVHESKKIYKRSRIKAGDKNLPDLFNVIMYFTKIY